MITLKQSGLDPVGGVTVDGNVLLDRQRLQATRRLGTRIPSDCVACINAYHCARGCPDACYLHDRLPPPEWAAFRCRVAQHLTAAWILDAARSVQPE